MLQFGVLLEKGATSNTINSERESEPKLHLNYKTIPIVLVRVQ